MSLRNRQCYALERLARDSLCSAFEPSSLPTTDIPKDPVYWGPSPLGPLIRSISHLTHGNDGAFGINFLLTCAGSTTRNAGCRRL